MRQVRYSRFPPAARNGLRRQSVRTTSSHLRSGLMTQCSTRRTGPACA